MQKDAPNSNFDQSISLGGGVRVAYPRPSRPSVRQVMRGNRRTDTKPEVRLRSELHGRGLRFRKNLLVATERRSVRPDVVFPRTNLAIFVDGCFWHGCSVHGTRPHSNAEYWEAKLQRNRERDRQVDHALRLAGWKVLRIWEHEDPADAACTIERLMSTR